MTQSVSSMEAWLSQLWAATDGEERRHLLQCRVAELDADACDQLATALKAAADRYLHEDIDRCLEAAALLLELAGATGNPGHRALGLLAEANAQSIGLSQYQQALALYDEATAIYGAEGRAVDQARAQIGKLWPLATLGRYEEALATGHQAAETLEAAGAWLALGKLTSNLAVIYGRMGEDGEALATFNRALAVYERLGQEGLPHVARVQLNRAIVLRNLGRFEASIEASEAALERLSSGERRIDRARAQQSLAITYFVLGKYNEALQLLDDVRDVFLDDGRERDAILVELFISDCLLRLRRFRDVLAKCAQVRELFRDLGTRFEVAQAVLNEAVAYAGLEQQDEARASLQEARSLFAAEGNQVWLAFADLEMATLLLRHGELEAAAELAEQCMATFSEHNLLVPEAQAWLVAARAASGLGHSEQARRLLQKTLQVAENQELPTLIYQTHYLLGTLARQEEETAAALDAYDAAITALEQLRGQLMVEFRADFLEDKNVLYEDIVALCLDLDRPALGLEYAERAKSRSLLDLLAYRLDVTVQARREADRPLVTELAELRDQRDRLYRRWRSGEGQTERGWATADDGWQQAQQEVLQIEGRMTELWHRLLIRNADYARDAALWQVRTEPVQPYLDEQTLLLEYFVARDRLILFLVTATQIEAVPLSAPLEQVQKLSQLLWLNLRSVPRSEGARRAHLARNAQAILGRLYGLLLEPAQEQMAGWQKLIIVPHGALHYLPFHALLDGETYLFQRHEVSYLPGASFLRYCSEAQPSGTEFLALGYSHNMTLPYTVEEAQAVARMWQGQALVEEQATRRALLEVAPAARLLHIAAHGDFRPDNPLFSGLSLYDGWLTTLDIFNLRINSSLVTLSACQTGRNVVAGGDELLGLMRAFLYAGTASLLLTFWAVEDRSTAALMEGFYRHLSAGAGKAKALQMAQRHFLEHAPDPGAAHPYFWAPFFLVGATDPLHL